MTSLRNSVKSFMSRWFDPQREARQTHQLQHMNDELQHQNDLLEQLNKRLLELEFQAQNSGNWLKTLQDQVHQQGDWLKSIESRLQQEDNQLRQEWSRLGLETITAILHTRQMLAKANYTAVESTIRQQPSGLVTNKPFDVYLEMFKDLHPHLYETWASINLGDNIKEFEEHPERSCANDARETAVWFKGFIAPYLHGRLLDIGCGPYALPNYLEGYPVELISGIDPLEPFVPHPFEFVRGFAEFLPWKDSWFDVVIAATSLDHTLSLDHALSEICRVLKPGGILLVWEWFSPVSKPYRPAEQAPELIDRYHLFNFSEDWFEELIKPQFEISEKLHLYGDWQYYKYYSLRLKVK